MHHGAYCLARFCRQPTASRLISRELFRQRGCGARGEARFTRKRLARCHIRDAMASGCAGARKRPCGTTRAPARSDSTRSSRRAPHQSGHTVRCLAARLVTQSCGAPKPPYAAHRGPPAALARPGYSAPSSRIGTTSRSRPARHEVRACAASSARAEWSRSRRMANTFAQARLTHRRRQGQASAGAPGRTAAAGSGSDEPTTV